VIEALPEIDPATRSRKVRIAADAECKGLFAGAQADVEIETGSEGIEALVVPSSAFVELKTATIVFVGTRTRGTFDVRPVQPGARIGGDVVVPAGLHEGDEVVVEGAVLLKGELIRSELGGEE
jgi:cobalt-zinc-cadmium efflux system membrane fusion protein